VVLAAPLSHDQPSEVWLLARVRFFLKPHKRIWNQTGMINLVTITAPKTIQRNLTKNLTQNEVSSRLRALANTIDSRGWAIKNINVNLSGSNNIQLTSVSDRLVDPATLPQDVPSYDITAADDMLDAKSNPTAQHLEQMIVESNKQHRTQVIANMNGSNQQNATKSPTPDYWFMNNAAQQKAQHAGYSMFPDDRVISPGEDPNLFAATSKPEDDAKLLEKIEHNQKLSQDNFGHMRVIDPINHNQQPKNNQSKTINQNIVNTDTVTDPAIINLALANKDNWSISTIAHQAEEAKKKQPPEDEVIVSLH
jgi:hypothetical protein